jgi:hypothetical protein
MQEHIEVIYDPANVSVQTLGDIAGVELSADGDALTTTFNPADFKQTVASGYTLYASKAADMADKVKVSASISIDENKIGHISIKQPAMNSLIFALGGVAEEAFTVYFQLEGGIVNDKNVIIAATIVNSNIVAATFTPYSTIILDKDLYPHVYPIGGIDILGSWSHDKVFQFIYDYNKSGDTYTGLLDLGEKHADGVEFKFTGEASWDDSTGNWGVAEGQEKEAGEIQLENGSSTNISQYGANRFYMFSLNTGSLVLTKKYGFNNVGIVGAFNGWNQADPDMKMTYNIYLHRFYIDQTFAENTELKFTCDDKWELNWGGSDGEIAGGGSNIAVEAGSYRVYLDLNHGTYELSSSMYGKDEPTGQDTPEPGPEPTYQGWGIIGEFNEWGGDAAMTEAKGIWTGYFTNTENGAFKFRKDADWAVNYGAPGDVEPYMVTLGTPINAVAGGKNLGAPAGFYKAVLDLSNEAAPTITITEGNVYSLIGEINGESWTKDFELTEKDGVWTSPVVTISGGFKIRHNFSWADENTYGVGGDFTPTPGEPFTAVQPGGNISVPAGDYKVQFTPETKEVVIIAVAFPEQLYMIGEEFGSWNWDSEGVVEMTPVLHHPDWGADAEAQYWTVRYFTAGKGFKFNSKREWGGDFWGLTTNDGYTESGGNCVVAEDGFYMVHVDFKNEKVHIEPARMAIVGDCTGLGDDAWNSDAVEAVAANIFQAVGKELQLTLPKGGKLRMYAASAIATSPAWTREFNIYDGAIKYRGTGGDLEDVNVKAGQVVTLKPNEGTGSISGEGEGPSWKAELTVAGSYSGCSWSPSDDPKLMGNEQGQFKGALVMIGGEFKFVHDGNWIGGTATELTYALGADSNMTIADGTYFWTVDLAAEAPNAVALPITKVGLIGSFNTWSEDVALTFNSTDNTYTGSISLEANAEFKVRFNGNWDYCLGGALNKLSAFGGNIVVAEEGTYAVVLNLNKGTLTLTK